ncbi:MAG: M10 family metallopeptidase C-terminal domain-containing protein [Caulobacteraceae bacterium]|nr:M10 family metallopeptidase C-terminal domain-containing protein [Caulobacter sp.]
MSVSTLTPVQDQEVTFLSGVAGDGTLAAQSFWTWDQDQPATYGSIDYEAKYGPQSAGQGSGVITYTFDSASNWTAQEQGAFKAAMALWSAEANVHFQEVGSGANFTIDRGADGNAETEILQFQPGQIGGTTLGHSVQAILSIDTSVAGFGPVGAAFSVYGGYPWMTVEHELGHVLGLGHTGPYDEGATPGASVSYGSYDSRQYSIMSYNDPIANGYNWTHIASDGSRVEDYPDTPQLLDIAALQRVYGLPIDTPLSGGQVFGFNSNIQGPIEPFFDFTQNTHPIVTLWDAGSGNTLDLSGFGAGTNVNLTPGAVSSVGGLANNLTIALGVHIDTAIGGPGADTLSANADGDLLNAGAGPDSLQGGAGADLVLGGAGDDTIYGGVGGSDSLYGGQGDDRISGQGYMSGDLGDDNIQGFGPQDTLLGGDGADTLQVAGHGWAFGNMGNDTMFGSGAALLFGGQGDDYLAGTTTGGMFFGNLGNDNIQVAGAMSVFGGQGDDHIQGSGVIGEYLSGDIGNDTISGGGGPDTIVGGPGADTLRGDLADPDPNGGASLPSGPNTAHAGDLFVYRALSESQASAPDVITDFNPNEDRIDLTAIDAAQAAAGQPTFHLVAGFDGHAGEAALAPDSSGRDTLLMLDANGDGQADFIVVLAGADAGGGWIIF